MQSWQNKYKMIKIFSFANLFCRQPSVALPLRKIAATQQKELKPAELARV